MLKQETIPEVSPLPFTSHNYTSLTAQKPEAVTPRELAQAIVAVEDHQKTSLQSETGSAAIQQAIAQCGLAVTPDHLLAEVHNLRIQSHQEIAMTPHKTQNPTVRILIAGLVLSSLAALLMMVAAFVFAVRFRDANAVLGAYTEQSALNASAPEASQRLQEWSYPGANQMGNSRSAHLASATMTTQDAYAKVWKFYADKTGYTKAMDRPGFQYSPPAGVSSSTTSGGYTEGGQMINWDVSSHSTGGTDFTTFTRHSPQYTEMTTLAHSAGDPMTTISTEATTPDFSTQIRTMH